VETLDEDPAPGLEDVDDNDDSDIELEVTKPVETAEEQCSK